MDCFIGVFIGCLKLGEVYTFGGIVADDVVNVLVFFVQLIIKYWKIINHWKVSEHIRS